MFRKKATHFFKFTQKFFHASFWHLFARPWDDNDVETQRFSGRSGGVGAPVRRGARVYVGFRRYERGSACLERSRSGVIVPLCEERGERIMPE